jgi:hypothetical protein
VRQALEALLGEVCVECERVAYAVPTTRLERHAIHQAQAATLRYKHGPHGGFVLSSIDPINLQNRNDILVHDSRRADAKAMLCKR